MFVADASASPKGDTNDGIIKLIYCMILRSLYLRTELKLSIIYIIKHIDIRGHIFVKPLIKALVRAFLFV